VRIGAVAFTTLTLACVTTLAGVVATASAATPDEAPLESREQVQVALRLLARAFVGAGRKIASGVPGTIEHVIGKFAPAKFHPVDEGTLAAPRFSARCPPEMALVASSVCVDRYEASLFERRPDGSEEAHSPYVPPESGHVYFAKSKAGVVPQAYVSGPQALAACRASGKRLCQPVEWRAACGGREGLAYPYGTTRVEGACHDKGAAPMLVYHGDSLKRGWGPAELNDSRLNQLANTVAVTGAYPKCVNDYGLFDMVGNLHEWSADPNGTFQGGYWLDTSQHGDGCAYRTIAHPFDYHDYSIGFRCCADPTE
jgi:hypothetical protein